MNSIDKIISFAKDNECSDIHITSGNGICLRRFGSLQRANTTNYPDNNFDEPILSMIQKEKDIQAYKDGRDLDFAYETANGIRCRVNLYHQQGRYAASLRVMGDRIPVLDEMELPNKTLKSLADQPRGLVLVTGPTGSGKSTTLAAIIEYINQNKAEHIITIEDPIEFVYTEAQSIIHQRSVGEDTESFATALRSALREDPDIILVGELRDHETISAALNAAETGHLVFGTLHTTSAADSVSRIINAFPPHGQAQVRTQLASVLRGVVTQQLLPLKDGTGRIAATEILIGTDAVLNMIRQDKTYQVESNMQSGQAFGMHTLNMDLIRLVETGKISEEVAIHCSSSPSSLPFSLPEPKEEETRPDPMGAFGY